MVLITVNAFLLVDIDPKSGSWAGILLAASVGSEALVESTAADLGLGDWQLLQAEIGRLSILQPSVDGWSCMQPVSGSLSLFTCFPHLWTMGYASCSVFFNTSWASESWKE